MIIYFYLFIPLLFITTDSSSIRDRSFKNELVPLLSSRSDPLKKDSNSLKIVSNEPFIIQLQVPNSMESEMQRNNENHKKRKRPAKKRASKIKGLRKKKRSRRDLVSLKTKSRQKKSMEIPLPGGKVEELQLKNLTKNSINRVEILKALSSYSKMIEAKQNKTKFLIPSSREGIKNFEKNDTKKAKHIINMPSRNLHKHHLLLPDRRPLVKMVYPSTPKFDENQHQYTYKDLMIDRERLEQKIKYIKNLLNVNDTNADTIRVRRRSDSDRTANKIAKMFLTLSAVNGLHDKRKSKCDDEDYEDEIWDKVRRNSPSKKSSSSNEERYKVKKWIEFMKNKRSSSKTCPCMENRYREEDDVFPLEQKLSNTYHLKETGRSSEESSESDSETFYHSRDRPNSNMNKQFLKIQNQENKFKAVAKNGKKTLELPLNDLELYRSRAKQILQNAEEILDRIKEEEEKRLSSPNSFISQLRELTSRIQSDPRNNENYLIRKIQKSLGWGPLAENKEGADQNDFMENVKSFILDPYEKAKALTDESTKKLSSYLLRNLGKIEESSEEKEEEANENDEKIADSNLQVYFEKIPQKEKDKPVSASLAKEQPKADDFSEDKEVLQNWAATSFGDANDKGDLARDTQEEPFKQKMEDIIKEEQKKLNEFKDAHDSEENNQEIENINDKNTKEINTDTPEEQFERETAKENKPEGNIEEEVVEQLKHIEKDEEKTDIELSKRGNTNENEAGVLQTENSSFFEKEKNLEMAGTLQKKKYEAGVETPENMRENKEFEKQMEEILKNAQEKDSKLLLSKQETKPTDELEKDSDTLKEENLKSEATNAQKSEVSKLSQDKSEGKGQSREEESETEGTKSNDEETNLEKTADDLQKNNNENNEKVLSPLDKLSNDEDFEKNTENKKTVSDKSSKEENSNARSSERQEQSEANEEDPPNADQNENEFIQSTKDLPYTSDNSKEEVGTKDSSGRYRNEELEYNAKQKSSREETNQIEGGARISSEHEVGQETNHEFNELSEGNKLITTESSLNSDEKLNKENLTVKSPDGSESTVNQEKVDRNTSKAVNDDTDAEDEEKVQEKHTENESMTSLDEEDEVRELNSSDEEKNVNTKFEKIEQPENQESVDRSNENESQLKAENPGNQENESLEKKTPDEKQHDTEISESAGHIREMSHKSEDQVGDFNRGTTTEEENSDERVKTLKEGGESPLRIDTNRQNNEKNSNEKVGDENEGNEKALTSDEKGSNETLLKMSLNEDQEFDTKNSGETDVEATNLKQSVGSEANNLSEKKSDLSLPVARNDQEPFNKAEVEETEDDSSQKETQKNESFSTEESRETSLGGVANIKQNSEKSEGDDQILTEGSKDEGMEDLEEVDKVASISVKPQSEGSEENERHGTMSQEENKRSEETTSKESNREQSQENQNSENSKETESDPMLKSPSDNGDQENPAEVNNNESSLRASNPEANLSIQEDESKSNEGISDGALEAVLGGEAQGKLNEASQRTILEDSQQSEENVDESNVKANLNKKDQHNTEEKNDDKMLKETNSEEPEQKQNNSNELSEGLVLEGLSEIAETNQIPKESKTKQNEENLLKAENPNEDKNDQKGYDNRNDFEEGSPDEASTVAMESQDREINSDGTLREENTKENEEKVLRDVEGEDSVKAKLEGTDNEIQETHLKTGKSLEVKDERELVNKDVNEEISQENTLNDLNNNIVREKDNGGLIKSVRFGEESRNEFFDNFETERSENPSGDLLRLEATDVINHTNSPNSQEQNQHSSDLIENSDSPSKAGKPGKLKVPKSIGKIMEDLEGKEKDDITSIKNLNPDKIDHIIYKIDEAEQNNLLQSQEIDCRKECACANEIDTKSRNIGRYEIAKDFLYWVKDLQLNRVLGDD